MGQTQPDTPQEPQEPGPATPPETDERIVFARPETRRLRTVIGLALDESGSMGSMRDVAIESFNAFVRDQAADAVDDCELALWKFNGTVRQVHGPLPIAHVPHLTPQTYTPNGGTALYRAVSDMIAALDQITADRIVVVVLTDGQENASHEVTKEQLADLRAAREATGHWTFVYLSSSPEAWTDAQSLGYAVGNTQAYAATPAAYTMASANMSSSLRAFRQTSLTTSASLLQPNDGSHTVSVSVTPTPTDIILTGTTPDQTT